MIRNLVLKNRSCRRYKEEKRIERETLMELVDLARLTPSARNMQPLKYFLSWEPETNAKIFQCLGWAKYLKERGDPAEGERPAAYIVILGDKKITTDFWCDHGITSQTILLGAIEKGLRGCIIGSIDRDRLREILKIDSSLEILLVLALGEPKEEIVIETVKEDGDVKYWRDGKGIHHVPKRPLKEIIIN